MEHTLYRSVWCSGSSLHCLCYRQCLCDISNGYLLTWWNRSDRWRTDLKVCSLRWCPLLLCWKKQDITMNTVYHPCWCKHRLLAKPWIDHHKAWSSKPLYGCIFLLWSFIALVCFTIYFIGSRSTSTLWLSVLFPIWLQWNLSVGTSLFKKQFYSKHTKFYPRKLFTLSLYLLPLLKGHLLSGKRDTSSGSQNPGFTSIQGTP